MSSLPVLAGIRNFRDIGGAAVRGGGRVRRGMLFRSGHFANATAEDWTALAGVKLGCVVDLRRPSERRADPSNWPGHFRLRHAAVEHETGTEAPHLTYLKSGGVSAAATRDYMLEAYRRIPYDEGHRTAFRTAFAHLAEGEGAAVVHCAAGKDRTGVLCSLVLQAAGAVRDAVDADYLASNTAVRSEADMVAITASLAKRAGAPLELDAVRPMLEVHPEYLAETDAEIARQHGGLDDYLRDWVGLSARELEQLRLRLVEPGDG